MANPPEQQIPDLPPHIRGLLSGLRRRIRLYVWLEGISVALVWIGLTFWAGLAVDYLPILVGASEMPLQARLVLLAIIAAVLAYILYRWIFRRTFARLADHSMAVLLERRFAQFHDGLVTAVEMDEHPDHAAPFNLEMLSHTSQEALSRVGDVRLRRVFNFSPLMLKFAVAILLVVPIGVFYAVNAEAFEIWVKRIYLLKDDPWPRRARIEVVGIELRGTPNPRRQADVARLLSFEDRAVKVARGASVVVKVRADASAEVIPDVCSIHYRTEENDSGRVNMRKIGRPRNAFQNYSFDGKPFKGILSSIRFDVVGYDHRVRDYRVEVVESPAVVETKLECTFPDYMVDEDLSLWLPRTEDLMPGTQLPRGSRIHIRARANKPLEKVTIYNPEKDETTTLQCGGSDEERTRFDYLVPSLQGNLTLDVTLHDTDGVVTERPHRIFIAGIEDEAPRVDVVLKGISTAVTPDVVIPVRGTIEDDYGVARSWFELHVDSSPAKELAFDLAPGGTVESQVDFREQRSLEEGFELQQGNKLVLSVKSSDRFDLADEPNVGAGDTYQLEVVSPDELLNMLERRELGLRRRFEQIIDEMTETRDSLVRVHAGLTGQEDGGLEPEDAEPKDAAEAGDDPEDKPLDSEDRARRARSLRLLRTQRALIQSRKSAQEVSGVATSFDDIREELINNRVDTEDRKQRLQEQIAAPLHLVVDTMFPDLERRLENMEKTLDDSQAGPPAAESAAEQANQILIELDAILQKMLELETYNELIDIVRSLIKEQNELIEKTKEIRKKELLEDLLK